MVTAWRISCCWGIVLISFFCEMESTRETDNGVLAMRAGVNMIVDGFEKPDAISNSSMVAKLWLASGEDAEHDEACMNYKDDIVGWQCSFVKSQFGLKSVVGLMGVQYSAVTEECGMWTVLKYVCQVYMWLSALSVLVGGVDYKYEGRRKSCRTRTSGSKFVLMLFMMLVLSCLLAPCSAMPEFLDTKVFGKPKSFNGMESEWKDWAFTFLAYCSLVDPRLVSAMRGAEALDRAVPMATDAEELKLQTSLYFLLVMLATGSALTEVRNTMEQSGLEAWRRF